MKWNTKEHLENRETNGNRRKKQKPKSMESMFFFAFGLFSKCLIPGILATLTGSYVCLALVISKISLPGIGSAMKVGISFFRSKSLIFCMYQNLPGSTSSFQGNKSGFKNLRKESKKVRETEIESALWQWKQIQLLYQTRNFATTN